MTRTFTVSVTQEGEWFVAQCLDVDVASQGETEQEALRNLKEALELHFEPPLAEGLPKMRQIEVEISAFFVDTSQLVDLTFLDQTNCPQHLGRSNEIGGASFILRAPLRGSGSRRLGKLLALAGAGKGQAEKQQLADAHPHRSTPPCLFQLVFGGRMGQEREMVTPSTQVNSSVTSSNSMGPTGERSSM